MHKKYKILISLFSSLLILLAFTPPLNPTAGGWTQQFIPSLNGRSITDIFFLDSLTGWSVTNATNQSTDTTYVLKTTNSGDNWVIQYRKIQTGGGFPGYYRIYFQNQNTGYTCGVPGIDKSTDGGINWFSLNAPLNSYLDMSVLNEDTIWLASSNPVTGGVYHTTNGGLNWLTQYQGNNPSRIYMYNKNIGFITPYPTGGGLYKTTNSGVNWIPITGENGFVDMYFIDSLLGFMSYGTMKKTTNGGLNWTSQVLPSGGLISSFSVINKFSLLNRDTIWGVGGYLNFSDKNRGIIYITTNGGSNWGFQLPDTSYGIPKFTEIQFLDKSIGWSYGSYFSEQAGEIITTGVHTTTSGDTTYLKIQQISNYTPEYYKLFQNYPNPFNPRTVISYELRVTSYVRLSVYDIQGKEIIKLVNQKQNAGKYQVDISGNGLSSGVYFYKIMITTGKEVFTDTKKMILIK